MKNKLSSVLALIFLALTFSSCGGRSPTIEVVEPTDISGQIQMDGSIKVQTLAEALGDAFTELYPDVTITVQGSGSKAGMEAVGKGKVDIGLASRDVKGFEFEEFPRLVVHTIAFDSIAIITSPDITLNSLTIEQTKDIFAGDITNFSEVGGPDAQITVVSAQEGSPSRVAFQNLVMGYGEIEKAITKTTLIKDSDLEVRSAVASATAAIGYLAIGFLDENTNQVPIEDVYPSIDNVHNGTYLIVRPLNMVTLGPPEGLIKVYLDWVKSEAGQALVTDQYITILADFE
jgi:phosphate transport system substrate-binding protein